MKHRIPTFFGGLLGGLIVYVALIARYWGDLAALTAGNDKGIVIVVAVAVMLSVLSGVVALAVYPKHFGISMLLGVLLPLLLILAGIPRAGIPAASEAAPDGKPSPMPALWFPLSPVASIAAGQSAAARDEASKAAQEFIALSKKKIAAEQETILAQAEARVQSAADAAQARALADQKTTLEARHQQTLNAAKSAWGRERSKLTTQRDQAVRRANEAEASIKTLEEKIVAFEAELRALRDVRKTRAEQQARLDRLEREHREAAAAADRWRDAAADYERVFGWYLREGSGAGRPVAVLSKKLASRDVEDRRTAARLLADCGSEAKKWLERAVNDTDEGVRAAATASLAKIG